MKRYRSAEAFWQALEGRLRQVDPAKPLAQKRQLLAFERFLERIRQVRPGTILKGGLGLRLRDPRARATRDVDVLLSGDAEPDGALLTAAGRLDLGDHFFFTVQLRRGLAGTKGNQYHSKCMLGGKLFAEFGVDAAAPAPMVGEVSAIPGCDWLSFIGIPPPIFDVYPLATQIAEKLHALTLPRTTPNTRDKDLPDLAILARLSDGAQAATLRSACEVTFRHRATHPVPTRIGEVPIEWAKPYARLVEEYDLQWRSFEAVQEAVRLFLEPVLSGEASGSWSIAQWKWR